MDIISKKRIKENRYDKNGRNHLCCGTNKPVILKNLERIYKECPIVHLMMYSLLMINILNNLGEMANMDKFKISLLCRLIVLVLSGILFVISEFYSIFC